jgi:hypothetical protein
MTIAVYENKIGIFEQAFPLLIQDKTSGEAHPGRLFVRIMELENYVSNTDVNTNVNAE